MLFYTNLYIIAGFPNFVYTSDLLLANFAVVNFQYFHLLLLVQTVFVHSNDSLCTPAMKHLLPKQVVIIVSSSIIIIRPSVL